MQNYNSISCASPLPYPPIDICAHHPKYGRLMLDNMGGADSEMSAIALYLYNHFITSEEYMDIASLFTRISIVEMHHLDIFGRMAFLLGEEPRLWSEQDCEKVYWTPKYNKYPYHFPELMENALAGELAAIEKYEKQAQSIDNDTIVANLKRIILDEKVHVEIFRQIIHDYCH